MSEANRNYDANFLLEKYQDILFIREFELLVGRKSKERIFQTPIHLGIGQEAISVGVSTFLIKDDKIFGNHRSHAHYLALGGSPRALLAEILGRVTGCSGGKGGSMHITSLENGFVGSMPIVAGTIPVALGSALALKRNTKNAIAVSYFGDGASEEGVFHESLNFAAIFSLPILFVCENNLFSSHMHIDQRQVNRKISRYSLAQGIRTLEVDGNDLPKVLTVAKEAIDYVRRERKPAMIEAFTYRHYSHVGFDEDLEVGLDRKQDLARWRDHDPLSLLREEISSMSPERDFDWSQILHSTQLKVSELWNDVLNDAYPEDNSLLEHVYWSTK